MINLRSTCFLLSGPVLFPIVVIASLTICTLGEARSQSPDLALPNLPQGGEQPAEYAFGDAVMKRDQHAWGPVFDALAPRFGKARLRVVHLALAATVDSENIRRHFDREMVDRRKWRPVLQETRPHNGWAYGYESPNGRHVFTLVGLRPRPGESVVPLSIVTTLPNGS
ncbi:hypothetical protein [Neorhizobium alkalisoli]|uniref:hypothetical protein n=1 Tax=Neorhizobium alkalisoli TaxID=528178 RepID=UPI000CF86761|nr:hypothetical protein [Neorhizobium alkalisoli]